MGYHRRPARSLRPGHVVHHAGQHRTVVYQEPSPPSTVRVTFADHEPWDLPADHMLQVRNVPSRRSPEQHRPAPEGGWSWINAVAVAVALLAGWILLNLAGSDAHPGIDPPSDTGTEAPQ